jgi:hypothetical protein
MPRPQGTLRRVKRRPDLRAFAPQPAGHAPFCHVQPRLWAIASVSEPAQCRDMTNFSELPALPADRLLPAADPLRLAVAAYLARFTGSSRDHTESDLRCYLSWCADRGLDPLAARRPHLELYIRWMQEIRRFKLSTCRRPGPPAPAGQCRSTRSSAFLEGRVR